MNYHKGFIAPLLALIAVLLIGGGAYVYVQNKQTNQSEVASQTAATSTGQTSDWQSYRNDKYDIQFSYPKELKIREELRMPRDELKNDSKYIQHPYFSIDMELPFVSKYDTWSQKSLSITVEDISGRESCFIESNLYTDGEKVIINGREYHFSKSYRNLDSGWASAKITTEKDSAVNTARADYVTKTNSFCYSIVFFLNGSGPNSEELFKIKNITYPSNSEAFFNSELEIFNKILNTVKISNNPIAN